MENKEASPPPAEGRRPPFPSKDLALLWRIPFPTEIEPEEFEAALGERIKELNCLYGVSQLAERHMYSLDALLQELVNFLPYSWQYPEVTCARILFKGETYTSDRFKVTNWRQSSRLYMYHEAVGECDIFYFEECPPADEGPFLKEERALLDAVAEQIGTIATRISADLELQETNRQLTLERQALQESNTAMRVVLARIEQEKEEIHQANLEEITSPFISHLSSLYHSLTPTEIAICNMIRNGLRTKEIAQIRGVSTATVNRHREHIRRKLKITNNEANLATYLQSSMWEEAR